MSKSVRPRVVAAERPELSDRSAAVVHVHFYAAGVEISVLEVYFRGGGKLGRARAFCADLAACMPPAAALDLGGAICTFAQVWRTHQPAGVAPLCVAEHLAKAYT